MENKTINRKIENLSDKFIHLRYMHTLAEQYKSGIYSRSQMLLAVVGVQLAFSIALANFGFQNQSVYHIPILFKIILIATISIHVITAFVIIIAILPHKSIKTIQKIIRKKTVYTSNEQSKWLLSSFNHVVRKERKEFKSSFDSMSFEDMYDDLSTNYYNLCHIINERYSTLRNATILEMICLFLLLGEAAIVIVLK